jgi:hypothetical protein
MAENLTQYKAYPPLLALLQQHGLPKDAISHVSDGIAQIVAEALRGRQGGQAAAGEHRLLSCHAVCRMCKRILCTAQQPAAT